MSLHLHFNYELYKNECGRFAVKARCQKMSKYEHLFLGDAEAIEDAEGLRLLSACLLPADRDNVCYTTNQWGV